MASRVGNTSPGGASDDFANFVSSNGHQNGHGEYEDEEYEEDIDFEPQNGYHDDNMPDLAEPFPPVSQRPQAVEAGKKEKVKAMKSQER